jgi:hypothetical protein
MQVDIRFVWYGKRMRKKLELKCGYLDIFFSRKKMMNSEIIVFLNLISKSLELCNETANQL